jgi:hypothetical protein
MTRNSKTPGTTGACICAKRYFKCDCQISTKTQAVQPRPGTALSAFLKRYEIELREYAELTGDRVALRHAEYCAALLEVSP